ncbi:ABC transporter permease [Salibaculum halophilum]|uniref:ABC transporter permease n=1 Tax=Salibaculum halophilum TaxID=1914408 RepID=UPI000A122DF7|nr:ABC transporter permease [Salibaculum halophilum]
MFETNRAQSRSRGALEMLELIYHSIVRDIRKEHRHAVVGLLMNIMQTMVFALAFYFMFSVLGLKGTAIRGDFMLYIMTGIFLFMTHIKSMGAVLRSEGPTSAMMKHAPMNTIVTITASALSALYIQVLSMAVVLYLYHAIMTPITIYDPIGAMGMVILAWFSGCAVGIVFLGLKPWLPGFVTIASSIYSRANMIASGKMFVANTLPSSVLALFDWNPLFHAIDQARGFTFINYNPLFTSVSYPLMISMILVLIGLMLEFYARRNASASHDAAR